MTGLALFDIDGTLIDSSPGHRAAFAHAFSEIYGIAATIDAFAPSGKTDQQIITEVLRHHSVPDETIAELMPHTMESMSRHYAAEGDKGAPRVLPGVVNLLDCLQEQGVARGLVTGNLEQIARAKLERAGLRHYFSCGGFGSDDADRANLVPLAIARAKTAGTVFARSAVFLFGDTPYDVLAGRKANVTILGVATGIFSMEQLSAAGPTYVLESLENTERILTLMSAHNL